MVVILAFTFSRSTKLNTKWLMLPMIILVFAVLFQFINFPVDLGLPVEVSPNYTSSWQITKGALAEKPILGSGPGTFGFDYSKFKPETINDSIFWNVRFDRAVSEVMTILATTGILGTVAWLVLMGIFIFVIVSRLARSHSDANWLLGVGLFSGFVLLFVAKFLYASNITLEFFTWLVFPGNFAQNRAFAVFYLYFSGDFFSHWLVPGWPKIRS
jgi:O-antigen ligase